MKRIYPLIVCGGKGTRLWPLSRTQSPKQFQKIGGAGSLTFFQMALRRHQGDLFHDPIVVTGVTHRGTVVQQLRDIQVQATVICEPMGRNTGPAVLAAAHAIRQTDPEAILVVVPADHVIEGDLARTMAACLPAAEAGHIISFGIAPRYPETGFGYIVDDGPMEDMGPVRRVQGFVEKPPADAAQALIDTGTAFWASGLSMFRAATIIEEYARFDPDTAATVAASVAAAQQTPDALYLETDTFAQAHAAPTEQVVFEKTDRIAMAELQVSWDDVGSWLAMYKILPSDGNGNVLQGDVIARDTANTMVRADSRLVSVVGLSDVIVVDTPDALLVAKLDETQSVKKVVEQLKSDDRTEVEIHADATPSMLSYQASRELEKVVEADRFDIGTADLEIGRAMVLEAGPRSRQVLVVQGTVHASGPGWGKMKPEGGRIYADDTGPVHIVNCGDTKAELLFVTLEKMDAEPVPIARAANG
ncbi:MAG: sugar phosphate nucleotidyltransferase [Pseudomonadota bacterium]